MSNLRFSRLFNTWIWIHWLKVPNVPPKAMQRSAQSMSPFGATTLSYVEASGESRLACSRDELACLRCFMTSFFHDFQRRSHRQPLSWPLLKTQPEHNQEVIFRHEPPHTLISLQTEMAIAFVHFYNADSDSDSKLSFCSLSGAARLHEKKVSCLTMDIFFHTFYWWLLNLF